MYAGPFLLRNIKDSRIKHRYDLLSYATRLLLSSRKHTQLANELLTEFGKLTVKHHGEESLSANVHSLVHLTWQVQSFGPLWCLSAMPFEAANFSFKRNFTGTVNHLCLQADRYLKKKEGLRKKPKKDSLFKFCNKLQKRKSFKKRYLTNDGLSTKYKTEASATFYCNQQFSFFEIVSANNKTDKNSFISYHCQKKRFGQVEIFFEDSESEKAVVREYKSKGFCRPTVYDLPIFLYLELKKTDNIKIIRQNQIEEKLIKIEFENQLFVVPIINCFEHD